MGSSQETIGLSPSVAIRVVAKGGAGGGRRRATSLRFVGAVAILAIAVVWSPSCGADASTEPAQLGELKTNWELWDSSIKCIELKGFKFVGVVMSPENVFTRSDVERLIYQQLIPLVQDQPADGLLARLEDLTRPLFHEKLDLEKMDRPVGNWRPFVFVDDGGKIRMDETVLGKVVTTIRQGGGEQRFNAATGQADIRPAQSVIDIENRDAFLYRIPFAKRHDNWSAQDEGTDCRMTSGLSTFVFDTTSGFVSYHSERVGPDRYYSERIQALPLTTSVGVPVPQVMVQVMYFDETNHVKSLLIHVVNDVRVNQEIDQARFVLSVPEGTKIVDFASVDPRRKKPDGSAAHLVEKVTVPVADAGAFVKSPQFGRRASSDATPPEPANNSSWRLVLIGVNVVLIVVFGYFMIRKASLGPATRD